MSGRQPSASSTPESDALRQNVFTVVVVVERGATTYPTTSGVDRNADLFEPGVTAADWVRGARGRTVAKDVLCGLQSRSSVVSVLQGPGGRA